VSGVLGWASIMNPNTNENGSHYVFVENGCQ
jgi:hypothetical protein